MSTWNAAGRIQGHCDPPLHPEGRRQAERLATRLLSRPWDALFASDLRRAQETAAILGRYLGLPVRTEPRLRERYLGRLQGLSAEEARQRYPDWNLPELGVEDPLAFRERALAALADIARSHPGGACLVVTHGGVIRAVLGFLHQVAGGPAPAMLGNTSVTEIEYQPASGLWRVVRHHDQAHLADGTGESAAGQPGAPAFALDEQMAFGRPETSRPSEPRPAATAGDEA